MFFRLLLRGKVTENEPFPEGDPWPRSVSSRQPAAPRIKMKNVFQKGSITFLGGSTGPG